MRLLALLVAFVPARVLATTFERPIPQPQTDAAEVMFLVASILLIVALGLVHLLVRRR